MAARKRWGLVAALVAALCAGGCAVGTPRQVEQIPVPRSSEGLVPGDVRVDFGLLAWEAECRRPLGNLDEQGGPSPDVGPLPAWLAAALPMAAADWPDPGGALAQVLFQQVLLQPIDGESAEAVPVLSRLMQCQQLGQEGGISIGEVRDCATGYRYTETGWVEPAVEAVKFGRETWSTALLLPGTDELKLVCDVEVSSLELGKPLRLRPVSYARKARGERVKIDVARPIVARRQIKTTVRTPPGRAALLGGTASVRSRLKKTGVPLLRSVPLIGPLFGGTAVEHEARYFCGFARPVVGVIPGEALDELPPEGRQIILTLRIVRFTSVDGGDLPPVMKTPRLNENVAEALPGLPLEPVALAEALLAAAPGTVTQDEIVVVAIEGAPFEVRRETETTYLSHYAKDERDRPVPETGTATAGVHLSGSARVAEDGAVSSDLTVGWSEVPDLDTVPWKIASVRPDGQYGAEHRLVLELPQLSASSVERELRLPVGETHVLAGTFSSMGGVRRACMVFATADILSDRDIAPPGEQPE